MGKPIGVHGVKKILAAMNAADMLQRDLAKALKVSDARISHMLQPSRRLRPDTLAKVFKAIDIYSQTASNTDWRASALHHIGRLKAAQERIRELEARIAELEGCQRVQKRVTPSPLRLS